MSGPLILLKAIDYSGSGPWLDETVNNNDATLENGTAAKNAAGNGLVLNGSTNWTFPNVEVGNSWTASVWYKNTGAPIGTNACILTQKLGSNNINFIIGYGQDTPTFAGAFDVNGTWYAGNTITLIDNVWTNIQVTWDGDCMTTYINGKFLGVTEPGGTAIDSGEAYRIGRRWDSADYMVGEIGEIRIYDYPITQAKVTADYNASAATFQNLLVLLKAVDYTSGTWTDQSAYGFNATLENGTATKNAAGNGLVLNGSTNWTFPNVAAGPRWTASVWYKNTGSPGNNACILTQIFTGSSINVAIGYLESGLTGGFYQGPWRVGNEITLTDGDWTNIQVTWDGTNLSTYINATLLGTTQPGGLSPDSGNAYRIGRRWDNPDYMTGEIGEVRIYNYPLTQDQVTTVYYDSFETFYSPTVPTAPRIHIRPKVSSQTIRLNWVAPIYHDGSPYHYVISCPQDINAPYDPISSTATAFTITGLTNGTQYTYSIKAVNSHGNGPTATYRTVRPGPKAPPLTTAVAIKTGADTATITNVYNTGLTSYYIGWSVAITNRFTDCGLPYKNWTTFGNNTIDVNNNSIPNNLDLTNDMYTFSMSYINDSGYSTAVKTNPIGNVQYTLTNPSNTYPYAGSGFTSVASDVSGQKLVACAKNGGYIWTSTNRGDTWVQRTGAGSRAWISVASSSNGVKLVAADQGGSVWTSGDSGVTWTERPAVGPSPQTWSYVAISANGTYALASAGVPGVANGFIYWSDDSGATWTQTGAPERNDWTSLTISDNGATLYATGSGQYTGPIYKSTDSGTTWNLVPFTGVTIAFYAIASSSDGTKLVIGDNAGGTGVWTSTDTGLNWTNNTSYLQGQVIGATGSVVSSDSGVKLAVVASGSIWTSADSGATWTQETTPTGTNLRIACDASGTTIYAVGDGNGTTGMYLWKGVYTSSWAWTQTLISADLSGNTVSNFGCITCSKNGQYIYVAITNLPIWKSSDYGATWAEISGSPTINYTGNAGVTCSDNGSIVMVFQYTVSVSSNYGVDWNANAPDLGALAATVRSTKLVVGNDNNGTYVSTDGGDTWTNQSTNDYFVGRALTMSTNGLVIAGAGGGVSVSTDGGTNWYTDTLGGSWDTIRVSADLTKLVVMNGVIFFSIDSGVSWKTLLTAGLTTWTSIWTSADFTKMAATTNGGFIRYSTDSGTTWADGASTGGRFWTSINGDSTGQYLVAVENGGYIWISRDYGASWSNYESLAPYSFSAGAPFKSIAVSPASTSYILAAATNQSLWRWNSTIELWIPVTSTPARTWSSVSISSNPVLMVAADLSGYLWNSGDGGLNWTQRTAAGLRAWSVVTINGGAAAAAARNGYIYTSTDSGVTWTERTGSGARDWASLTISADNVTLYAGVNNGYIYTSADSGVTWTTANSTTAIWSCIRMSPDTTKIVATNKNNGYIYLSTNSGSSWSSLSTAGSRNWTSISVSDDFVAMAATVYGGGIYWSTDSGATWTLGTNSGSKNWSSITGTSTNQTLYAVVDGGTIWTSSDSGATWAVITAPGAATWLGAAISADATTMVAGETVPWVSNNGGADWRKVPLFSPGTVYTFSSFVSSNGTFIAVAVDGTSAQNIWTSSDSGYSWLQRTASGPRVWTGIAGSSNGSKLVAVADSDYIYTSTDYGATWTQRETTGLWRGAASDSTGVYLATTNYGGYIYTSDDSGVTWTQQETARDWSDIASDSTGQYLVALVIAGSIWTSADYGNTWTERTVAGTRDWHSVSCSAYGNNIVAAVNGGASLWTSSDFGATWNEQSGSASGEWYGVASSANAKTILATRDSGNEIVIGRIQ